MIISRGGRRKASDKDGGITYTGSMQVIPTVKIVEESPGKGRHGYLDSLLTDNPLTLADLPSLYVSCPQAHTQHLSQWNPTP